MSEPATKNFDSLRRWGVPFLHTCCAIVLAISLWEAQLRSQLAAELVPLLKQYPPQTREELLSLLGNKVEEVRPVALETEAGTGLAAYIQLRPSVDLHIRIIYEGHGSHIAKLEWLSFQGSDMVVYEDPVRQLAGLDWRDLLLQGFPLVMAGLWLCFAWKGPVSSLRRIALVLVALPLLLELAITFDLLLRVMK